MNFPKIGHLKSSTTEPLPPLFYSSNMMMTESSSTKASNIWWNISDLLVELQRRNKQF